MANCRESAPFVEQLQMQLSETELLQSMFAKPGEFHIDDPSAILDIEDYVAGKSPALPRQLDYILNIELEKGKFEVSCSLPRDYPCSEPEVYIRCDSLSRDQKQHLNNDLSEYMGALERGEMCMGLVVQWVQEHADSYITDSSSVRRQESVESSSTEPDDSREDNMFSRYWIYSHHIYNKMKRRSILDTAKEYQLTGFCLPGKPGIICTEGMAKNCAGFWTRIKSMNWKKIMCKKKEMIELGEKDMSALRFFKTFEEIAFESRHSQGRDYHMDMGAFYRYLEDHKCGFAFKDYFGVDGFRKA